MLYELDIKEGLQKARQAFNESKLGSQGTSPTCRYLYPDGRVCIIGAMLPDEVRKELKARRLNSRAIYALHDKKLINIPAGGWEYGTLQRMHDGICKIPPGPEREAGNKALSDFINTLCEKYEVENV